MKSNASNFITRQQMAAMMGSICSFTSVGGKFLCLRGCVVIVREMETCTEHSSVGFKQRA
jgi:hypothetical protein